MNQNLWKEDTEHACETCLYGVRYAPDIAFTRCVRPPRAQSLPAGAPCPHWTSREERPPLQPETLSRR